MRSVGEDSGSFPQAECTPCFTQPKPVSHSSRNNHLRTSIDNLIRNLLMNHCIQSGTPMCRSNVVYIPLHFLLLSPDPWDLV